MSLPPFCTHGCGRRTDTGEWCRVCESELNPKSNFSPLNKLEQMEH